MKLFLGKYDHILDERGRVTLPRKIRYEIHDADLILSKGYDGCIFGFDREHWEREATRHLDTPVTDEHGRNVRRYLFASAEKVDLDKLGRILVPTQLKEYASIQKDVVVVGAGDHFELWNPVHWEKRPA